MMTAEPRFFGVTPPAAVLALAAVSLALALVLLVAGHVILGAVLLVVAVVLGVVFASLARRLPDTPVARVSLGAMSAVKAHAGFAVEALSVHSSARGRPLPPAARARRAARPANGGRPGAR